MENIESLFTLHFEAQAAGLCKVAQFGESVINDTPNKHLAFVLHIREKSQDKQP